MKDIFWIKDTGLAIVLRPRGDDWLQDDVIRLKNGRIQTLVCTVEEWEAGTLGLANERAIAEGLGLRFISYPMQDRSTPPDRDAFKRFVSSLAQRIQNGEKIGVHCRGCIGRSTVMTACTLITMGWSAADALDAIEFARECSVPDTEEQREWIMAFGAAQ